MLDRQRARSLSKADTLVQDYGMSGFINTANVMNARDNDQAKNQNRFKKMVYRYYLTTGRVNHVAYRPTGAEQMYHRYLHEAENSLIEAE